MRGTCVTVVRVALLAVFVALLGAPSALARSSSVDAGHARFEVMTPTLIRMQYAEDGAFQTARTMTATRARLPVPAFTVTRTRGVVTITTARVRLRYRTAGGPLGATDLSLRMTVGDRTVTVYPRPGSGPGNLGGWTRALDNQAGPVPLHDGILATSGWYVLGDTATVLLTKTAPGFAVRPAHSGRYQDLYLFAYGHDYARGLADLRALTGPTPLLPRTAFGVWFSRFYPYSEAGFQTLLGQFRSHRVPLDTLSVDTDFKRENDPVGAVTGATLAGAPGLPYSWNGWDWNTALFPQPQRFVDWAHAHGLALALNVHPSIDTNDPSYAPTVARYGPLRPADGLCQLLQADTTGTCKMFDWADPQQLAAYFSLHEPFAKQGVDLFWLDWCCEAVQRTVPGLTPDTWINAQYAADRRARGSRWGAFSRIGAGYTADPARPVDIGSGAGALAEHRSTIQFTGDTCATWSMLAFEARLSASEGNIGLPYVSHDIGSYNGDPAHQPCGRASVPGPVATASRHLPDDLYARWVQFGTFQPLDRLHSNHGDRLPWEYGPAAEAAATSALRLREALGPLLYTLARRSYDTGLPITGALYLQWPSQPAAYRHPAEYTFGPDVVVAPVTTAGDPAPATVWVPPGTWVDYFTGQRFTGPATVHLTVPVARMPVLVRAGAVIPTEALAPFTTAAPNPALTLTVFGGTRGRFTLYDDSGLGFAYQHGSSTRTVIAHTSHDHTDALTIGAARGSFPGALRARRWTVAFRGVARPEQVTVDGRRVRFAYDASTRTVTIHTGVRPTRRATTVTVSF